MSCRKLVEFRDQHGRELGQGLAMRLQISNIAQLPVRGCRGHLTKLEFRPERGAAFSGINIFEPYLLPWAKEAQEFEAQDIFEAVPKYLVFASVRRGLDFWHVRSNMQSFVAPHKFCDLGEYRITISLTAENGPSLQ